MKRTHLKQLFHILFYILLLCVLKGFVNNSGELNLTYFSGTKCNPINESYQQFQVEINGITYPKHVSLHLNKSIDFKCLNKRAKKRKLILFWNNNWACDEFGVGKDEIFKKHKCPVHKCETTTDKSRINESDYVITDMGASIDTLPQFRPSKQRWIFMMHESPYLTSNDYSFYNGKYNLTATYRDDSDFLNAYEGSASMTWELNKNFKTPSPNKTKGLVGGLISNCGVNSRRLEYINELKKYMPVDLYGRCGDKKCPDRKDGFAKLFCKDFVSQKYKFYLAFENSLCNDYITEKFFATLKFDTIPIVLGDVSGKYEEFVKDFL